MKCHNLGAAPSLCLFISVCASNCVRVTALTTFCLVCSACMHMRMRMLLCCACVLRVLGVALLRMCSAY